MEEKSKGLLYSVLAIAVICLLGVGYLAMHQPASIDQNALADAVASKVIVPSAPASDLTGVNAKLDALSTKIDTSGVVDTEKVWKNAAIDLAKAELASKTYKDLYNFIDSQYNNIDVRTDISSVVIKNTDVTNLNEDNKDATVTFDLKVYYETTSGDKVKIYVTDECSVKDNEVDNCEFSVTA